MKLGIIFGGASSEHEVSIVSATSVIVNLDKEKYQVYPIYLDKENNWYQVNDDIKEVFKLGDYPKQIETINPYTYLKTLDKVFPVMHGAYGEDGAIQGFLKMLGIPYVGCEILASSVCIDKFYTKYLLKNAGINVASDITLINEGNEFFLLQDFEKKLVDIASISNLVTANLGLPVFVKPASMGSSVGVTKVLDTKDLESALKEAFKYDPKILIEKAIVGREIECAILNGFALSVGEIHAHGEFYSFVSKYEDKDSYTETLNTIDEELIREIKKIAEKAFRVVDGKTLARVDFFLEDGTNKIILNEINTLPGFTSISMYPKLAIASGISYQKLLDILILE